MDSRESAVPDWMAGLQVAKYQLIYEVGPEGANLPNFKGATFRGAFGHALRQASCLCSPRSGNADGGRHEPDCPYLYIFEGKAASEALKQQGYEDVPRPFLISPPTERKNEYSAGEKIYMTFTLFGRCIAYLPMFIQAFDALGANGVGYGRKPICLRQVFALDETDDLSQRIYDWKTRKIELARSTLNVGELLARREPAGFGRYGAAELSCLTPVRLKYRGGLVRVPPFSAVVEAAVRRTGALLRFHHELPPMEPPLTALLKASDEVNVKDHRAVWTEWERYSNRQKARIPMGGVTGTVRYEGDMMPFAGWLSIMKWTHIGKNTTFGLGEAAIQFTSV